MGTRARIFSHVFVRNKELSSLKNGQVILVGWQIVFVANKWVFFPDSPQSSINSSSVFKNDHLRFL